MTPGQDAKDARTLHDCRATRFQPFDPPPDAFPMLPFPAFAFVDLETTGTRAGGDRITEIGIVRVDCASPDAPPRVTEWATLVDPQVPIPGVIQALTGIGDAMVSGAPTFSAIAPRVQAMLDGRIFAAHNARFDFRIPEARVRAPRPRLLPAHAVHAAPGAAARS
ncbi:MAG TPA: 3'-5' exonuclease [Casimicrobiaceae bacterium]|nr:3'-5' exonuclease [Casimicrobiaceae bacterium]